MSTANLLATEASLYLRQHADDPVHWQPWGDAAFERARREHKPLLLSIGYASCHWCHVMARESFRDPEVAAYLNEKFVSVKVDREERPDVDAVYMAAVQALTGHGGWPLTVALTPSGEPFYGGTYFPPEDRPGMPSFRRVLRAVVEAWEGRRPEVERSAQELTQALRGMERAPTTDGTASAAALAEQVYERLRTHEDVHNGGFGGAPKFPPHETLRLLLTQRSIGADAASTLGIALRALHAMAAGGIRDQLGGGFARYSVDAAWHVPHFEMMLYDNAAMLRNYATAYALTADVALRDVAYSVVSWLLRTLAFDPTGSGTPLGYRYEPSRHGGGDTAPLPLEVGFFNALDADQAGAEGAYYVWTEAELVSAAGEDGALAAARYGVTTPGAFEGRNVLRVAASVEELAERFGLAAVDVEARLARAQRSLHAAREQRPRPAVDDKAMASWNGLALGALATAGRLLADEELLALARANARYLRQRHWHDGRLWHVWRRDQRSVEGLLEDYAYVGLGLLDLYRATLEAEHLEWALELAHQVQERFHDEAGGYFSTATNMQKLVVRPKGFMDAATPSENAAAAELVWWAARYQDDAELARAAAAALAGVDAAILQAPQAFASSLRVRLTIEGPQREVVLAGELGSTDLDEFLARWRRYDDGSALVLLLSSAASFPAELPLAEGRAPHSPGNAGAAAPATAYVCTNGACRLPDNDPESFERSLQAAGFHCRPGIDSGTGQR